MSAVTSGLDGDGIPADTPAFVQDGSTAGSPLATQRSLPGHFVRFGEGPVSDIPGSAAEAIVRAQAVRWEGIYGLNLGIIGAVMEIADLDECSFE